MGTRSVYTEDHEAYRESVRGFIARHIPKDRLDGWRRDHLIDRDIWLKLGEAGFLGLEIPEEHGGVEAKDYRFNAVLLEELSRVSIGFGSSVSIHCDIVVPYLVHLTTEEQRKRWLPGCASGEIKTAIGMTEPSVGSDLAALRTRLTPDGDGYLLNGSKTFITNGSSADLVVVAASSSPEKRSKGITLVVVEKGAEGFTQAQPLDKVGQPESDTSELYFENVHVPAENVIGEVDRGFIHLMEFLAQERLGVAVCNLAHADEVLHAHTLPYVKERKAFGQPIGTFQHNKFLLADLVTKLDVTRAYVDECVAKHSRGELTAIEAAQAKLWTSDVQSEVIDACLQLHGGYGYMNEYEVAQAWKDARVTKIYAGSNEIMKEIVGRSLGL